MLLCNDHCGCLIRKRMVFLVGVSSSVGRSQGVCLLLLLVWNGYFLAYLYVRRISGYLDLYMVGNDIVLLIYIHKSWLVCQDIIWMIVVGVVNECHSFILMYFCVCSASVLPFIICPICHETCVCLWVWHCYVLYF